MRTGGFVPISLEVERGSGRVCGEGGDLSLRSFATAMGAREEGANAQEIERTRNPCPHPVPSPLPPPSKGGAPRLGRPGTLEETRGRAGGSATTPRGAHPASSACELLGDGATGARVGRRLTALAIMDSIWTDMEISGQALATGAEPSGPVDLSAKHAATTCLYTTPIWSKHA